MAPKPKNPKGARKRGAPVYADPIKALIDAGSGRDVDTVIVDGKILVQGGRAVRIDEAEVYAKARQATQNYWSHVPDWRWDGAGVERIIPPAFPTHRAPGAGEETLGADQHLLEVGWPGQGREHDVAVPEFRRRVDDRRAQFGQRLRLRPGAVVHPHVAPGLK